MFYKYLINSVGRTLAKQYLDANEKAISNIYNIIVEEQIDCDFEWEDSYVFTQSEKELKKIKLEVEAVNVLGKEAEFVETIPVPIKEDEEENSKKIKTKLDEKNINLNIQKPVLGAIKFKNQAQFNPCKYGLGLAKIISNYGGEIFENSKVYDVNKKGSRYEIISEEGSVFCKHVVLASHYPILNYPGFYFLKMYQEISYLIAGETKEELFDGMYITSEEPTISLRILKNEGKRLLVVGGMKHKTGAKIDLKNSYKQLENVAKQLYPDVKIKYYWNTEDCVSLDKIPYIGEFSNLMPNVYVGTGYKKWGMTTSNIAANIITDKILGNKNEYEEVFASTRLKPVKNYKELGNMVKEVGNSLILNRVKDVDEYLKDVKQDEGKIVTIEGKKVGVYRDKNGIVYGIKPYCSHLGCELAWNNLNKTWDCPCHGSRFDYEGKSLYDPSIKDLEKINLQM